MEELIFGTLKEYGSTVFIMGLGLWGMFKLLDRCEKRDEASRQKWEASQNKTVDIMSGVIQRNNDVISKVLEAKDK